ncbi:pyrimidine 5-nucleotidase [Dendrothele bispora CBS 962.96]|uniref:Pyrimidine 5-nucleotidase n=1 Tax=Dendrothele bispora (strain CBS 962.96) TaxID=1314807 RepID=A0A4S8MYH6_DENBC|nr:pyrimidine 5-nucleotidase [Dendrothele bispora CBS 962.96]
MAISTSAQDERLIVWFDIDNTLYSANTNISAAMGVRIHAYFVSLGLSEEEASELHHQYYSQYGLALAGLVRNHDVDPLDFDRKCDGSLPLEEMIQYSPSLRKLFEDIDRSKVRVWALTNAYRPHAERVLRILRLADLIDGLVFCDYEAKDLIAKPDHAYYHKAMKIANVSDPSKCYFVDDNKRNVMAAKELCWGRCVYFCEKGLVHVEGGKAEEIIGTIKNEDGISVVSDLEQLREVWPEIFKAP